MNRRVVAGALLAAMVVVSGCTGILSGSVTFSASEATVSDDALESTGYEHNRTDEMTVNETFSVAGQSRDVEVTNWISEYHRSVGIDGLAEQRVAVFTTFSSPKVSVLGQSFNPLAEYDNRELAEQFTTQLNAVNDLQEVGSRNVTMLGSSTEVTKFEATVTTAAGLQFDAYVHVTKVEHGDDHVAAIGVYPQQLPDEQETVNELIRGVEHEE
ncbi:DUF6517 family protein [Halorussus amylolyticus]|uniref:DUF6517 family protein n=1 Tax=Halorussus amylolyticus TaxID=1126242 RepID=UPI0010480F55|nr:DUF6517 family protein [Halorussus amylolyticus]